MKRAILGLWMVVLLSGAPWVHAQDWSQWELEHAVSRHSAFLAIKQPSDGSCYVKQSYHADPSRMELLFSGGELTITTPFFHGIRGDMTFWVDDGSRRRVPSGGAAGPVTIELAGDIAGELQRGRVLTIHVNPIGEAPVTQRFSLKGFTAAVAALSGDACRAVPDEEDLPDLGVALRRGPSGVYVSGKTTLPDGIELMVSLRAAEGNYFADAKAKVVQGVYRAGPFNRAGRALEPGVYRIHVGSTLMAFQPAPVQKALGSSGEKIPEAIRTDSTLLEGVYTVHRAVVRRLD